MSDASEIEEKIEDEIAEKSFWLENIFRGFAERASVMTGTPIAFIIALTFVGGWLASGSRYHYSDGWLTLIAIVPSVTTFLLAFLIQNSQNREMRAIQLKLNELIRATRGAHTMMVNLEKLTEKDFRLLTKEYEILAEDSKERLARGQTDQHVPEISITNPQAS